MLYANKAVMPCIIDYTMKQYVVTAYDYTDALQRRMDVRPHHLDKVKELKANNNYIAGGAILNGDGQMIGSVMMVQFENDEQMDAWKNNDPYVTGKVWETIDVKPFRQAVL
jgi:uncharacterized protein YciI